MSKSNPQEMLPLFGDAIIYIRTSTNLDSQAVSREETQPEELRQWAKIHGYNVVAEYTDTKSGKTMEGRHGLFSAIAHANAIGASILVTELSRLTRSVADCATLLEGETKFIVTRSGRQISKEMLLIQSVFAQAEREATSKRMKAMLKGRFERSPELRKEWGNQRGIGLDKARWTRTNKSLAHAEKVGILALEMLENGSSYQQIADRYNQLEIPTMRGGKWNKGSIYKMVQRLK